jgi:hypothetical protein
MFADVSRGRKKRGHSDRYQNGKLAEMHSRHGLPYDTVQNKAQNEFYFLER